MQPGLHPGNISRVENSAIIKFLIILKKHKTPYAGCPINAMKTHNLTYINYFELYN